ncbi:hypothetical protein NGM10_01140 [Halorussus salilacus]|uniref:DUF7260 family protein n=1 Tax=Halorussus salilacus TaxID=2953750 RepID=UPI0020A1BB9D|nr:hypothetical protein [Halorussus salilacus]USZ68360.1 hypothetical protein NGM10_01140 [Halorussus salilacus]
MTGKLRTHAAVERAEAERERAERKRAAFEAFGRRVRSLSADCGGGPTNPSASVGASPGGASSGSPSPGGLRSGSPALGGALAAGGAAASAASASAESVREAFGETVLPLADPDSLHEAVADELSPDIAAALSPASGGFSPESKAQLVARADERVAECRLLADALATERDALGAVGDKLDRITEWVSEADETPLLQLGFEQLRERHDRLEAFRETCDELARERQSSLRETVHDDASPTGIRMREVRRLLYADFSDDHPVLADLARLDSVLAECQRSVRRHLCARV